MEVYKSIALGFACTYFGLRRLYNGIGSRKKDLGLGLYKKLISGVWLG